MTIAMWAVAAYFIVATTTHIGSILIAMSRCRKPKPASRPVKSETALGLVGLTRYLRRTGLRVGTLHERAVRRRWRQSRPAGLRDGKPHRRDAAFGLPPRLSPLRDHLLRGERQRR